MSIRTKTLNDFLYKHKDLAPQGSNEWLKNRIFRIGGSEFAIVLNKSPYSNKKNLIKTHVGLSSFKGYAATFWGNLFEDIIIDFINNKFQCNIKETGSINCDKGTNLGYSPDGIAIIKKKKLEPIIDNNHYKHIKNTSLFTDNHDDDELLILFEFKCPYKRIPDKYIVPEYYLPQPQLGMEIIKICETSIFIEAVYRICSIKNIQYNNIYNTIYHTDKEIITNNPLSYGFIAVIYDTCEYDSDDENDINKTEIQNLKMNLLKNENICVNINNNMINDLGKIEKPWLFNKILKYIVQDKILQTKYINHIDNHKFQPEIFDKSINLQHIYNYNIEYNLNNEISNLITNLDLGEELIGIIPYKLFQLYIKPVKKEVNFITPKIQKDIDEIIDIIKECNDKTYEEKEIIINKYFPSKRKKTIK